MSTLWQRLNVLVPEPQCRTFSNDYSRIEWNDARPKPTEAEINAVTQEQVDATDPRKELERVKVELAKRRGPVSREDIELLLRLV